MWDSLRTGAEFRKFIVIILAIREANIGLTPDAKSLKPL